MVVHRHNAQDVQPPQSDLNVAGGSGTNIVEESQWTKYCAAQQDINSDRDSDGGEEEGSNIQILQDLVRFFYSKKCFAGTGSYEHTFHYFYKIMGRKL